MHKIGEKRPDLYDIYQKQSQDKNSRRTKAAVGQKQSQNKKSRKTKAVVGLTRIMLLRMRDLQNKT